MHSFQEYLAQGQGWLFIPVAIVLGALHGLEPGHSKTMMAAFIVSIRGTVAQATLLGLAAAFSHTLIIWVLAFLGLHFSGKLDVEGLEPWFQAVTGVIIIGMAVWMLFRVRRDVRAASHHHHDDAVAGPHGGQLLDIEGGRQLEISVFETNVPPRFRLYFFDPQQQPGIVPPPASVRLETIRPDGAKQVFEFRPQDNYLEATEHLPEPHEFAVVVQVAGQTYRAQFLEHHHHAHGPADGDYQDAHEREHAEALQARFAGQHISTSQVVLFGLTGGLMPCPAAFAVLLICLQIKQFALGFATVLAFSTGLAITLVTVGAVAALSLRAASRRFAGFSAFTRRFLMPARP